MPVHPNAVFMPHYTFRSPYEPQTRRVAELLARTAPTPRFVDLTVT